MKTNFHTHSRWCDGVATLDEMAAAADARGFDALGFSSHVASVQIDDCVVPPQNLRDYVADVRRVADEWRGRLRIFCGAEVDYIRGITRPHRGEFAELGFDYLIGSVHYVIAPDGARVSVDSSPESLRSGIDGHFAGSAESFVRTYFAAEREMIATCDFDILGHADLCRKFNAKFPYFDESSDWYRQELALTADAIAASRVIVEVNTGAIARGWLDSAYPSREFRSLLASRGVRFVLSSDAHSPDSLDCAFDRYAAAEDYVTPITVQI